MSRLIEKIREEIRDQLETLINNEADEMIEAIVEDEINRFSLSDALQQAMSEARIDLEYEVDTIAGDMINEYFEN